MNEEQYYTCPNCGGMLYYTEDYQYLMCPNCNQYFEIPEDEYTNGGYADTQEGTAYTDEYDQPGGYGEPYQNYTEYPQMQQNEALGQYGASIDPHKQFVNTDQQAIAGQSRQTGTANTKPPVAEPDNGIDEDLMKKLQQSKKDEKEALKAADKKASQRSGEQSSKVPKKKDKFKTAKILVVIIGLVAMAGIVLYMFKDMLFGKNSGDQEPQNTEIEIETEVTEALLATETEMETEAETENSMPKEVWNLFEVENYVLNAPVSKLMIYNTRPEENAESTETSESTEETETEEGATEKSTEKPKEDEPSSEEKEDTEVASEETPTGAEPQPDSVYYGFDVLYCQLDDIVFDLTAEITFEEFQRIMGNGQDGALYGYIVNEGPYNPDELVEADERVKVVITKNNCGYATVTFRNRSNRLIPMSEVTAFGFYGGIQPAKARIYDETGASTYVSEIAFENTAINTDLTYENTTWTSGDELLGCNYYAVKNIWYSGGIQPDGSINREKSTFRSIRHWLEERNIMAEPNELQYSPGTYCTVSGEQFGVLADIPIFANLSGHTSDVGIVPENKTATGYVCIMFNINKETQECSGATFDIGLKSIGKGLSIDENAYVKIEI